MRKTIKRNIRQVFTGICALCITAAALLIVPVAGYANNTDADQRQAIVKINTVSTEPYYFNPWMTMPAESSNGSGSIIKGNIILTNAHVVANHTFIEVWKLGDARKYKARILHISHEADLALLGVEEREFFSGVSPLQIGDMPAVQKEVRIFGFPGGETLTVTKGMLSALGHRDYIHSSSFLLAGQIQAPIKPGNSGGPVLLNGKIAGVIMQAAANSNLAHMVPAPVIRHFLKDIDDGHYDGFPDVGLVTQKMESPSMKKKFGLYEDQTGVRINKILPGSPAEGKLKSDDILLAINGQLIGDDSTVEFRPKERTDLRYFMQMQHIGSTLNIDILRDGQIKNFNLTLNKTRSDFLLVPLEEYDRKPRYFIYAGIVFSPLTKNFINSWDGVPEELVVEMSHIPTRERKEVVVALQVLPADVNKGYHNLNSMIVETVNGQPVRDFGDFYNLVTTSADPFITFVGRDGYQIVIDRAQAEESHKSVLRTYSVTQDRSEDLPDFHAGKKPFSLSYQ